MSTIKATKLGTGIATITLSLGMLSAPSAVAQNPEMPADNYTQQAQQTDVEKLQENIAQINNSTFAFKLAQGDKLSKDGSTLVNQSGAQVALPSTGKDVNGNAVNLKYTEENGIVTIQVFQSAINEGVSFRLSKGWKCGLGTGGGAGTGALAGAAAGATIGSALPGIGTVAGWAIGSAIGGAVSGGATGAAAFC
ncbi:hypothetical protein QP903_07060 [Corynebacterium pseudodiphtheriticum]|uniref:hypothetical protein n=1 Tax=Corynebacterium pseudodiphtheriticum TaxID=37637 RepID=UPI00254BA051|nr:hypothetical protein [Corynebacterium pseudodiphtheriticum]MDK8546072.1 hypothetical protein [Corynebacterium pseudodiphtheriticum]